MVCESHSVVSNSLQPHGLYISLEFSRPEYWSGYFLSPGELPNPGIEPRSPTLQILYQLSYKGSPIYGMVGAQQIQDGQWMQTFPSSLGLFYPSLLRPGQYFIDRWGERECSAEKWTIAMNNQHRTFVKTKALFQSGVIYFQKLFLWVLCEADSLIWKSGNSGSRNKARPEAKRKHENKPKPPGKGKGELLQSLS